MDAYSKVTSLEEVLWGMGLVAVTMIIHAFAMPMTLAVCGIAERRAQRWRGFFAGVPPLLLASGLIVITHLVEVVVWAIFFVVRDAFPTTSAAFYYSPRNCCARTPPPIRMPRAYRRVMPARNHQGFYDAFGIRPGDKMWIDQKERVAMW